MHEGCCVLAVTFGWPGMSHSTHVTRGKPGLACPKPRASPAFTRVWCWVRTLQAAFNSYSCQDLRGLEAEADPSRIQPQGPFAAAGRRRIEDQELASLQTTCAALGGLDQAHAAGQYRCVQARVVLVLVWALRSNPWLLKTARRSFVWCSR